MEPLIITAALVGAELSRKEQPYLPLSPEEIAAQGLEAIQAGASILHLHVRNPEGNPTCNEKIFKETIDLIRQKSNVIIQVSTGGAIGDTDEDRCRPLLANPDMASLTTGSINFGKEVFLNPLPFIEKLAQEILAQNIKPEIEVFDLSMLETGIRLIEKGLIKTPAHFQFVLGVPGALAATEKNLKFLVENLLPNATWSLSAIGRFQFPLMELAIQWGGHARLGFEDNIYLEKGVLAKSNAELVTKGVELAQKHGRKIATIEQAREILGLSRKR